MRGGEKAAVGSWQLVDHRSLVTGKFRSSEFGVQSSEFGNWLLAADYWRLFQTFLFQIPYSLFLIYEFVFGHLSFITETIQRSQFRSDSYRVKTVPLCPLPFALCLFILILVFNLNVSAQTNPYLYQINQYNFIRYDLNGVHNFGSDSHSQKFFEKLESLAKTGEGRINIVQIGGSHVQAGTFSGQIRSRLQQMDGEMNAGWGFMFPYRISRTNTPFGYYIRYSGDWQSCRNVETRKSCTLGVGGISATTSSQKAEISIVLEKENTLDYRFNKIRVFYENPDSSYTVSVDSALLKSVLRTSEYFDFVLNTRVDSLTLTIQRADSIKSSFALYGISTESAPNGFLYHSIGVNGASVPSFLRCDLFTEQLALLKPDLVILGLGINDAYGRKFSQAEFESNYKSLIYDIRKAAPETAIIFTTNNDSYLYRRYVNKNGEKVQQSMLKMAKEHDAGVWNMYEVMGGLNSVVLWEKNNLVQRDKVHFTREGYLLLGDLFFSALMKNFESYIQEKKLSTANNK